MTGDRGKPGEFDLIASVFAPLTDGDERALGLLDDAAVLPQAAGRDTVITTDTMVEGIHFLDAEPPDVVARRLLRVNLSDLASMGAEPTAYVLNLTLPARTNKEWLSSFAEGLRVDQSAFGVRLLGGDTTHTKTSLTVTATLLGEVPTHGAITRGGARAGDDIYVSGTIGDASLGLKMLISGADNQDALVKRFQLPDPRVSLGAKLRGLATAMADVSDGLAADLVTHLPGVESFGNRRHRLPPALRRRANQSRRGQHRHDGNSLRRRRLRTGLYSFAGYCGADCRRRAVRRGTDNAHRTNFQRCERGYYSWPGRPGNEARNHWISALLAAVNALFFVATGGCRNRRRPKSNTYCTRILVGAVAPVSRAEGDPAQAIRAEGRRGFCWPKSSFR